MEMSGGQVAMTAEHVRVSVCMHKLVQKDENQATLVTMDAM